MTEVARKIGGKALMRMFFAIRRQGKIIAIPTSQLLASWTRMTPTDNDTEGAYRDRLENTVVYV
jgi:hypothetical protein